MASTSDLTAQDQYLCSRLEDIVCRAEERYTPGFIGFLDERETALIYAQLQHISFNNVSWRFYGGYEDAERTMLGVFPKDCPLEDADFPLDPIAFCYRKQADISHRDVLGSLIGCGIKREKIGDILCTESLSVAFIQRDLVAFVRDTIERIGREGVRVQAPYSGELPVSRSFRTIRATVASARLDCVLKALLNVSREQAAERITSALVFINHKQEESVRAPVKAQDMISVRGVGRFVVDEISSVTKKGRLVLAARQYL